MPLLADGAMGTELLARSGFAGLPARLNLLRPELVVALHREYAAAGARLLVANTLGGTPAEVAAGVRLAREASLTAVGGELLVAASLSSVERELVEGAGEADVLLFETLTEWAELPAAAMATFSFGRDGTLAGLAPADVARRAQDLGLEAWGYGCGFGPEHARPIMRALRQAAPEGRLIAKPNLGLPPYGITPEQLAAWGRDMAALGVDVIGACCGSTPAHIRALGQALIDWKDSPKEDV